MFSAARKSRTSIFRATFLLLILALLLAFRCGWFVQSARAIEGWTDAAGCWKARSNVFWTDWGTRFGTKYKQAKAAALAKQVSSPPWYAGQYEKYRIEYEEELWYEKILITPSREYFHEIREGLSVGPINFGTVRALGEGRLELCPRTSWQPGSDGCIIMCAIPWGERQYLIENDKVDNFVGAIDAGKEPRNKDIGEFYMRQDDWEKPVQGRPLIPKEN